MNNLVLQRRRSGPRAEVLLEELQRSVPSDQRARWNETGHARLPCPGELDVERKSVASRLDELADDWSRHIAIL
jgi:hypothetical protein